jgi:hypothetical protein
MSRTYPSRPLSSRYGLVSKLQIDQQSDIESRKGFAISSMTLLLVVGTVVGYPVVTVISAFGGIENRALAVLFRAIVLAVSILLICINPKDSKPENRTFWMAWWAFWLPFVLILMTDQKLALGYSRISLESHLLFAIGTTLLPAIATRSVIDIKVQSVLPVFMASIGTIGIAGNYFYLQSMRMISLSDSRLESEYLNPISYGHCCTTVILTALWCLTSRYYRSKLLNLTMIVFLAIAIYGLLLSASRGPVVALVSILLLFLFRNLRNTATVIATILVSFILIIFVFPETLDKNMFFFRRFEGSIFQDRAREYILRETIDLIFENPLFGSGVEPLHTYPHNLALESFLVGGIVLGIPFLLINYISIRRAFRSISAPHIGGLISILFFQYLISGLFSGALSISSSFFLLMTSIMYIPLLNRQDEKKTRIVQIA